MTTARQRITPLILTALIVLAMSGGCSGSPAENSTGADAGSGDVEAITDWGVLVVPDGITPEEVLLVKFTRAAFINDYGVDGATLLDPSSASFEYRTQESADLNAQDPNANHALGRLTLSDGTVIEVSRTQNRHGPETFWQTAYDYINADRTATWTDASGVIHNPRPADSAEDLVGDPDRQEQLLLLAEQTAAAAGFESAWVREAFVADNWNSLEAVPEAKDMDGQAYQASMIGISYDAELPGYRSYLANAYSDLETRPEGTVEVIASYDGEWNLANLSVRGPVE